MASGLVRLGARTAVAVRRCTGGRAGSRALSGDASAAGGRTPTPQQLQALLGSGASWEDVWKQGVTPWEARKPAPALTALLQAQPLVLQPGQPRPRALVPGCGSGWDALALARAGYDTTGVDLAPTAVDVARKAVAQELQREAQAQAQAQPAASGSASSPAPSPLPLRFEVADVFTYAPRDGPFDLVWDYTLMAALPPAQLWAPYAQALRRLVKPGGDGLLAILLFPVDASQGEAGPPFHMEPARVDGLLREAGFATLSLAPVPPGQSHKARAGREWLGLWS